MFACRSAVAELPWRGGRRLERNRKGGQPGRDSLGLHGFRLSWQLPFELLLSLTTTLARAVAAAAAATLEPPTTQPPAPPPDRPPAATMSDERQPNANLIRLWRVWRTAKEMMHDRVGCARQSTKLCTLALT